MANALKGPRETTMKAEVVVARDRRIGGGVFAMAVAVLVLSTMVGTRGAEAAFPGANGKIVFDSDRLAEAGGPGLYTITPGSTATKIPGTTGSDNQPAWSPDGSRIAFQSSSNNQEISIMNADGSGRAQLTTTPASEQEPTWSPDGSRIAFSAGTSGTDATTDLEIFVMNADGSGMTQLTNNTGGADDTEPAWSPSGDQLAFRGDGRSGDTNNNIYVMDTDPTTNDAVNLTPNDFTVNPVYQYNEESPSWSPDGTQITYSTGLDIWKMNADGTGKTNLTGTPTTTDLYPAWSPDGNSIAYASGGDIYVMGANGGNKTPIDTTLRQDLKPDWQPDPPTCDVNGTNAENTLTSDPAKDEVVCGLGGNDTINGQDGDILLGGDGNDRLSVTTGWATMNGGVGNDTASFEGAATNIEASLISGFAQRVGTSPLEGVSLVGIENLIGSGNDDILTGSNGKNKLTGGPGSDDLFGLGKPDTLNSRDLVTGNDSVNGGSGSDDCVTDRRDTRTSCP